MDHRQTAPPFYPNGFRFFGRRTAIPITVKMESGQIGPITAPEGPDMPSDQTNPAITNGIPTAMKKTS